MERIALITDSTCGLSQDLVEQYNVHILRLKIIYKDKSYIDGIDITPEEVYAKLEQEIPTTSMPSYQDACDLFENLIDEGYTHVIAMPISSGLSGTINSLLLAAEQYADKLKTFIFDTKLLSMAVGLSLIEIGKMIETGESFDYICNEIPKLRAKTSMYFVVDTLEYLIKGGRIGKVSGALGQVLNLKPILSIDNNDGKYITHSKVRGSKQSLKELTRIGTEILNRSKGKVAIMTGTMYDELETLKKIFKDHKNITTLYTGTLTPVVGVHSGPRLIGFAILEE